MQINTPKLLRSVIFLVTAGLLGGCSSRNSDVLASAQTNSVVLGMASAGDFLLELHNEGRLPGDAKGDHGNLRSDLTLLRIITRLRRSPRIPNGYCRKHGGQIYKDGLLKSGPSDDR